MKMVRFHLAWWTFPAVLLAALVHWGNISRPDHADPAREVRAALDATDVQLSVDELRKDFLQDFRTMNAQHAELQRKLAASEAKREAMQQVFILQGEKHQLELRLRDAQMQHRMELDSLTAKLRAEREMREAVERQLERYKKQIESNQQSIARLKVELYRMEAREADRIAELERREKNNDKYYLANYWLFRTWTSLDGTHTVTAKFVKYEPSRNEVFLRKANGRYIWVDVDRLSRDDQLYIFQRAE